ncbi:MAG: fumarate hydratase C-terminal domain-containing protein [Gallionella sp.]|nr:fumarate hydratase C-terminal domain-containing protein [Gallionella sp.]
MPSGVDFTNGFIYYVVLVYPVCNEVIGPAEPATAIRKDKFTESMLEPAGLIDMASKDKRGKVAFEAKKKHDAAYLIAIGQRFLWRPARYEARK